MSVRNSLDKGGEAATPVLHPLVGQLATLVGAMVAGWLTISGRLQRVRKMRTDCAGRERSFIYLYVVPQYVNGFIFVMLVVWAMIAVAGGLMSDAVPDLHLQGAESTFGRLSVGTYRLGWMLVLMSVVAGALAYMDVIAHLLLGVTRLVSRLPLRILEGRFGPAGRSLGWLQAREFVRSGKDALPLTIDPDGIDRLANPVHEMLTTEGAAGKNRAATPQGSAARRGNIALFACILEQVETDLRRPRRSMDKFYAAFAAAQHQRADFFEPAQLLAIADGRAFWSALQGAVDPLLTAAAEAPLVKDLVAQDAMVRAFSLLKNEYGGDVTRMAERRIISFHSKANGLYRRARRFPKLEADEMAPQFVKLCLRWGVIPFTPGDELNPAFASSIAWRMLDEGAVQPLADVKDVSFLGSNLPIFRIAEWRIIARIADFLEAGSESDAPAFLPALNGLAPAEKRWMIEQEIDTALWRNSREQETIAATVGWVGSRWKLDDRLARRI